MTPLYSKETAEELIYEINDRLKTHDISYDATAIVRLIENGNEVIQLMSRAETACRLYGGELLADDLKQLIKKIKGEG
jgi:hypothetical protein